MNPMSTTAYAIRIGASEKASHTIGPFSAREALLAFETICTPDRLGAGVTAELLAGDRVVATKRGQGVA